MSAYLCWLLPILVFHCYENEANGNVIPESKPYFIPNVGVLHGNDAEPHSAPYMVALDLTKKVGDQLFEGFCGGTLISRNYVLTAAHCIDDGVFKANVILGVHNWRQQEETQVRLEVNSTSFTIHKDYIPDLLEYDIALLKLPSPVTYNEYIKASKLPEDDSKDYEGQTGRIYGWGFTAVPPEISLKYLPSELKYADFLIAPSSRCIPRSKDYDGNICILTANEKGTCKGDSGGPLVVDGVQVGITSYGSVPVCDEQDKSAFFTRVGKLLDWIRDHSDLGQN